MTAADMIAALDAALVKTGTSVILRRYPDKVANPTTKVDVALLASERTGSRDKLAGDIDQIMREVVIGPTEITAASWPVPIRKNDKLVIGGREINIEVPGPIEIKGTIVRYNLVLKG